MSDVADAYETDRSTIFGWVNRFQEEGEEGLVRRPTSGRPRKLQDLTEEELRNIVLQPASDFGYETDLWTAGRLHTVIEDQYRVRVSKDTIWRRLREAGLTYQKPDRVVASQRCPPLVDAGTCCFAYTTNESHLRKRLHVFYLPKYSPDWNPDEKVWNHLKHQELTRHQAKTTEELKTLTRRKLQSMAKRPCLMRGIFFRCCVAELFG